MQHSSEAIELTPMTAASSTVQHPFAKSPKPGLWHVTGMQLAPYIQNVAHALLRKGRAKDESEAIHMAYGIVKRWAQGKNVNGKHVTPEVQAAAARNIADMDAKRMKAHMKHQTALVNTQDALELANLMNINVHKLPAAMRRVKKHFTDQGVPDKEATAKTVKFFKSLKNNPNPILNEASKENIKSYGKRKGKGKSGKEAGGDTGYSYKEANFANAHHDGVGKFAGHTKERELILRAFQAQHNLPETGIIDVDTREMLQVMTKAVTD